MLGILSATRDGRNAEVLRAWPFSMALVQVGDDTSVDALQELKASFDAPPNIKHWAGRIEKALSEQWRKKTKEWPEPGRCWEGAVEETRGYLLLGDTVRLPVECALWYAPLQGRRGKELVSWGGMAVITEQSLSVPLGADNLGLELEDGRQGRIVARHVSITQRTVTFVGSGMYPKTPGVIRVDPGEPT